MQLRALSSLYHRKLTPHMSGNNEYNPYDSNHTFAQNPSGKLKTVPSFSSSKNYGLVSQPLTLSHHRVNARSGSGVPHDAEHSPGQWNQT